MEFYSARKKHFESELLDIKKQYNTISLLRFAVVIAFLASGWFSLQSAENSILIVLMFLLAVVFALLMKRHSAVTRKRIRAAALVAINTEEINYLNHNTMPFEDGHEFIDHKHPYSYDLDIFGQHSLFQNTNRTQTFTGKEKFASLLLKNLPQSEIAENQKAIIELAGMTEWRQEIMALGRTGNDSGTLYNRLMQWAGKASVELPGWVYFISYAGPVAVFALLFG
ncbi:MAG: DNA mismatch repair protein, partial [Flavobacterium sp.]